MGRLALTIRSIGALECWADFNECLKSIFHFSIAPSLQFNNGSELDYPNCQAKEQHGAGGLSFTPQIRNEKFHNRFYRPAAYQFGSESAGVHCFPPSASSHLTFPMC